MRAAINYNNLTSDIPEKCLDFNMTWEAFGQVPLDEDECLEVPFYKFTEGTDKYEIWHWFEKSFSVCLGEILYGD